MKKTALLGLFSIIMFGLTSCEPEPWHEVHWHGDWYNDAYDDGSDYFIAMAQTLRGKWTGEMDVTIIDDEDKTVTTTYSAEMEFDQYNANSINGRGVEIDYFGDEMVYQETFLWYIDEKTEDINIKFDDGRHMIVDNFHLDGDTFYGSMMSLETGEYDEFSFSRFTYANTSAVFEHQ